MALTANNSRILCCFVDQESARPYESALINCGVALLRARDAMHAVSLAISSQPKLAIIEIGGEAAQVDVLLDRIQTSEHLADLRVLLITDHTLPATLSKQFAAVPRRITPADLAARVRMMVTREEQTNVQHVDEFFSMWGDVVEDEFQIDETTILRTDAAGNILSARSVPEATRASRSRVEQ